MTTPTVRVVGLGPGGPDQTTHRVTALVRDAPVARLRTRVHPAAAPFADVASYDDWYESAESFEALYLGIAEDLARLAAESPNAEVVFAVPGSPVVAERVVELLVEREDVVTVCEPAVSVLDVVCAALRRDPMSAGLRIVDALATSESFRGPGPLLILQAYSPEVMATVAERLAPDTVVTVLHHVGLPDQIVTSRRASELAGFGVADHLTSLWVETLRTPGDAVDDLVDLTRRLRRECPWDQEQSHASLTRHLLEEAYEAIDALEALAHDDSPDAVEHAREELGDVLFQILFHAELFDEEARFDLAAIADAEADKLVGRHPHIFGDVVVADSGEVAARWEVMKRDEKGRESVTDGIAWQLPALTLYTKLLRKAIVVHVGLGDGDSARTRAITALSTIDLSSERADDAQAAPRLADAWGDALVAMVEAARFAGVDLEGVLRDRAIRLRDDILRAERSGILPAG